MGEVDLLDRYPRTTRDIAARAAAVPAQREVASRFAREYFDGDRGQGYGGYRYDGRWVPVAERFRDHYRLAAGQRVLDVGCAKGFLLHDLRLVVPGLRVAGLDVSSYAIAHAMEDVRPWLTVGSAERLPFPAGSFDLVVSINTVHNLDRAECVRALVEIERVGRGHRYVQVDSWLNDSQREKFERWQLTARTYSDPAGWRRLFAEAGYRGDYYWTVTE
ncbi:MAG TPA: class I SAM-dependent methyltransferase [Methylomirabilota bacterium]|nr:class I SAM-dependent methyltransferase [Methylomirabilota bacterium]